MSQHQYTRAQLATGKIPGLTSRGGKYYLGGKQVIAREDVQGFLRAFYDAPETGFAGRDRMWMRIYREYYGISRRDVAGFLANLETAQVHQEPKRVAVSRPLVLRKPRISYACDLTWLKEVDPDSTTNVEKNSQIVLTCIDMFSKYAWATIVPSKKAPPIIATMKRIFDTDGAPSTMRSDNGGEFTSVAFKKLLGEYSVKQILSDVYQPTQNAIIERFNKTLKTTLYKFMSQYNMRKVSNADLQKIVYNYNHTPHTTTKQIPAEVHKGDADAIYGARKEIKHRATIVMKNIPHTFPELRVGDTVRVARRTMGQWRKSRMLKGYSYLTQWFYELFRIAHITQPNKLKSPQYSLLDPDGKLIEDRKFLRQDLLKVDPKTLIKEMSRNEYVVEAVLDSAMIEGKKKYLVKWKGHSSDWNSWEVPQPSYRALINKYEAENAGKPAKVYVIPKKTVATPVKLSVSKQFEQARSTGTRANTGRTLRPRA